MTTYTITWDEVKGLGRLIARNASGDVIRQEAHDYPIDAATDADSIAQKVFGDTNIVGVDHDGEFVHVHVDWS